MITELVNATSEGKWGQSEATEEIINWIKQQEEQLEEHENSLEEVEQQLDGGKRKILTEEMNVDKLQMYLMQEEKQYMIIIIKQRLEMNKQIEELWIKRAEK